MKQELKHTIMKKVIFAILVVLAGTSAFAEKADSKVETKNETAMQSLSGNVIDKKSGEALVGVEVKVEGSDQKAYTDFDGHFVLDKVKTGECKLVANYISYDKSEKTFELSSNANQVKIELQASK
jgi:hypothetical protein